MAFHCSRSSLAALCVTIMVHALVAAAKAAQINTNGSNFAIGRYDPVASFTDGKAIIRGAIICP